MPNVLSTLGDVQRTLPAGRGGPPGLVRTSALERMHATLEELIESDRRFTPSGRNLVCADALASILVDICCYCSAWGWSADRVVDRAYHRSQKTEVSG
jgi:hypothetical protein